MLYLYLLGAPRLECDHKPIELDTRKAFALAAYLALTPTAHARDELAAFFYPDADAPHARAALRRTLSALKSALGETALEVDRETIALRPDKNLQIDVLEFRRAAQSDDMQELVRAVKLYQGDFLAGFTLRDSPAFDEWQFFETESLRKQFASVLERLVAHETESAAYPRAIEYARRWLALDALHEPAHRALMLLYTRDGQRAAALRQYHECVRQLEQELGVAPLPETTRLFHAIEENRISAEDASQITTTRQAIENRKHVASRDEPSKIENQPFPFVGRARELAQLLQTYAEISNGGRVIVLQGEAGIGKTRLAQEFILQVSARGAHVLRARGYVEQRAIAYASLVQALRAVLNERDNAARVAQLSAPILTDAARLLPEFALPSNTPSDSFASQARFFDAMTEIILALTRNRSAGVFLVDDAQWLDDASLELLAFFIRRLRHVPLLLLLTWRGEEIASDHLLRRLYAEAARDQYASTIDLKRLEREPVQELIDAAIARGVTIKAHSAEQLYRESEGQPFFLVEFLKWLEREGALPAAEHLPASVRELLHSRLAHTGQAARQLLGAAAVIGRSFDFEILRAVSGRSEEETINGVEELSAHGLIVDSSAHSELQYDFTHDKLRELVYQETSLARRRLLHRRAADALAQRARSETALDAYAGQIAQHYRAGGAETLAAEFYKRAGDFALTLFAHRDAVEYYASAMALGFGATRQRDTAQVHQAIGDAQTLLGEYDAALRAYETAVAFGAENLEPKIACVYVRRGEWTRAISTFNAALQNTTDTAVQAQLYADLAFAEHHAGDDAHAQRHAQHALHLAQRGAKKKTALTHAQGLAQAQAHNILGILARRRGEWHTAQEHLQASFALAEQINAPGAQAAALNNLALVAHATGDDAQALACAQHALTLVIREGDRHRQAALRNLLADLYHARGQATESMQQLKQAIAIYAEIGGGIDEWQPEIWKLEEW